MTNARHWASCWGATHLWQICLETKRASFLHKMLPKAEHIRALILQDVIQTLSIHAEKAQKKRVLQKVSSPPREFAPGSAPFNSAFCSSQIFWGQRRWGSLTVWSPPSPPWPLFLCLFLGMKIPQDLPASIITADFSFTSPTGIIYLPRCGQWVWIL